MADQNLDATGTTPLAPSWPDAVKDTAARNVGQVDDWPGNPVPDRPTGVEHLDPAINPAPLRAPIPERIPVPVRNSPGLVGAALSLNDINRAARGEVDTSGGITADRDQSHIREATLRREDEIGERVKAATEQAVADAEQTIDRDRQEEREAPKTVGKAFPAKGGKA